jgi:small multidrug resistance pump
VRYVFLGVAICSEVFGTSLLKATAGFTRLWPTTACLAAYAVSFLAVSQSVARGMPVGTAYAVWSGLGTTLIVLIGVLFLREPVTLAKALGVALVIAGVAVLNLAGAG